MMVKSLQANHDENVYPQHFLFEKNGKRFLYACDGAWFLTETYYALYLYNEVERVRCKPRSGNALGGTQVGQRRKNEQSG